MQLYTFKVSGGAADGQTWTCEGMVEITNPGAFMRTFELAMQDTYKQLTNGKAVFGKPGVGCKGPYQIEHFEVKLHR